MVQEVALRALVILWPSDRHSASIKPKVVLAASGLLLAASGCSWLLLATPGCAWRLLATPLAATIHASTDSWGRNFHMTQNISLITVFGHCAPGTRWILSRATLNHPYHRFALLDLLQSLFDVRPPAPCSGFPPTMAKKVLEMISRRLVLPIEFVRLHFCFSETRAIKGHSTNSAR